ncbi:MAG: VIT1/CCC1 transporter family protein [Microgenomates group bacterium]|nr:VIT1/CCC1 transporter family protein [Microgenomates group bacterium]
MPRIDKAREAFLKKDLKKMKLFHAPRLVHRAIHNGEKKNNSFILPQIILGGQDGLVNVLGLILGVAAATSDSRLVIISGLAMTFAESFSMAAVAYNSKLAEADYYQSELEREKWEIENNPNGEKEEIKALYENYGFQGKQLEEIIEKITSDKKNWLQVMMEQELKLEKVDRRQAFPDALIVGVAALIGSLTPLLPFFFLPVTVSVWLSVIITSLILFGIGYYKAKITLGRNFLKMGFEMMAIGMLSALVGYLVGSLFKV